MTTSPRNRSIRRARDRAPGALPPGLELAVPGVLGVDARALGAQVPDCPALQVLLARARRQVAPSRFARDLCARTGLALEPGVDEPLAALALAGCGYGVTTDWCVFLTPVHMQVDRDRALVLATGAGHLDDAEEAALLSALTPHLAEYGVELTRAGPGVWVGHSARVWDLRTVPLDEALGRDAGAALPDGADARPWIVLVNELQMLLHAHPVNRRRDSTGALTLNSLWPWGAGRLPGGVARAPCAAMFSDQLPLLGLATLSGASTAPAPRDFESWRSGAPPGLSLVAPGPAPGPDEATWCEQVQRCEARWFAPALRALRAGHLGELRLWLGTPARYRLTPFAARWAWRRQRPLRHYLVPMRER